MEAPPLSPSIVFCLLHHIANTLTTPKLIIVAKGTGNIYLSIWPVLVPEHYA